MFNSAFDKQISREYVGIGHGKGIYHFWIDLHSTPIENSIEVAQTLRRASSALPKWSREV